MFVTTACSSSVLTQRTLRFLSFSYSEVDEQVILRFSPVGDLSLFPEARGRSVRGVERRCACLEEVATCGMRGAVLKAQHVCMHMHASASTVRVRIDVSTAIFEEQRRLYIELCRRLYLWAKKEKVKQQKKIILFNFDINSLKNKLTRGVSILVLAGFWQ